MSHVPVAISNHYAALNRKVFERQTSSGFGWIGFTSAHLADRKIKSKQHSPPLLLSASKRSSIIKTRHPDTEVHHLRYHCPPSPHPRRHIAIRAIDHQHSESIHFCFFLLLLGSVLSHSISDLPACHTSIQQEGSKKQNRTRS